MRRLIPQRRFLASRSALQRPSRRLGPAEWVLSRADYRLFVFDGRTIPVAERAAAAALRARQWSTHADGRHAALWRDGVALIAVWDHAAVAVRMREAGVSPSARVLPETFLHPPTEGARMIRALDGIEGQFWQDGMLRASRHWADIPLDSDWQLFLRDAGCTISAPTTPVAVLLRESPWGSLDGHSAGGSTSLGLRVVAWATGAVFLTATVGYAMHWLKLRHALTEARGQLATATAAAAPAAELRAQAESAAAEAEKVLELSKVPPQPMVMAEFIQVLPESTRLIEWQYRAGQTRALVALAAGSPPPRAGDLIEKYEARGAFRNVRASATQVAGDPAFIIEAVYQPNRAAQVALMADRPAAPSAPPRADPAFEVPAPAPAQAPAPARPSPPAKAAPSAAKAEAKPAPPPPTKAAEEKQPEFKSTTPDYIQNIVIPGVKP